MRPRWRRRGPGWRAGRSARPGGGVAHPLHQFAGGCAGTRSQRCRQVAEIVEVEVGSWRQGGLDFTPCRSDPETSPASQAGESGASSRAAGLLRLHLGARFPRQLPARLSSQTPWQLPATTGIRGRRSPRCSAPAVRLLKSATARPEPLARGRLDPGWCVRPLIDSLVAVRSSEP